MSKILRTNALSISGRDIFIDPNDSSTFLRHDGTFAVPTGTLGNQFLTGLPNSLTLAANTYIDILSGNIGAGTWLMAGMVNVLSTANAALRATAKIWNGSTSYTASEGACAAMGANLTGFVDLSMIKVIQLTGAINPIALACCSTLASSIVMSAPKDNAVGIPSGTATSLSLVRLL